MWYRRKSNKLSLPQHDRKLFFNRNSVNVFWPSNDTDLLQLFNQITLVCDWFWNVDCGQSKNFVDYSNSRLYQGPDVHLLDDQDVFASSGAVQVVNNAPRTRKNKKKTAALPDRRGNQYGASVSMVDHNWMFFDRDAQFLEFKFLATYLK